MKVIQTKGGKHNVQFYDSIHDMPIRRYSKFNMYMMIDSQVGESIGDYDKRNARCTGYLAAKDYESARIELINQRQTVHHALEQYSPSGMALAIQVHSIDGIVYEKYTDADLDIILDKLDSIGFTRLQQDDTLEHIKKKIQSELLIYHASKFSLDLNYNVAKINELKALADYVCGLDSSKEQLEAENEMLRLSKAEIWNIYVDGNAALAMENGFEEFLFLVAEHTKEDLELMTVYRFNCLLDYIKSKK